MTKEEAFLQFCEEYQITDIIQRELRVRPVFMHAWDMAVESTLEKIV